jgi:1,4-alpha-glucan branching enzyme
VNFFNEELVALAIGRHQDPHRILGLHENVIILFKPGFEKVEVEIAGQFYLAKKIHELGFFSLKVSKAMSPHDYKIYQRSSELTCDPYSFLPTLNEIEFEGFSKGHDYAIYKKLGAHTATYQGIQGVRFAVWAPNALGVSLAADFNHFSAEETPMRLVGHSGVYEIFIPGFKAFEKYKYCVTTQDGSRIYKTDPFGYFQEMRPHSASVFVDEPYQWNDFDWMEKRQHFQADKSPVNIYELHLGSWKKKNGNFLNYVEIAEALCAYCKDMGYTHVEILPVTEHPLDESWGYQVTGFYAVTSRFGNPNEFRRFVEIMHQNQIGVILDWVGAHFPIDEHALEKFDGTALFEHSDPRQGYHPQWDTLIFNYGRFEVLNFLIGSVLFWLDEMHIDGIRMDAVSSMIYLDFGRENGNFIPNRYGGKENLEAIDFIKHLNSLVHQKFKGVITIAEESTAFPKVTHALSDGGLGFDFKSNLGWMNDTLHYFEKDPIYRSYHHNLITFYLMYAFSEKFALFLSHDEVVHGKKSLISKMPGSYDDHFKNVKVLLSMMMTLPGKKLLFMGGEFGQWNEWNCTGELDWSLLSFPKHDDLKRCVKNLNHFYLEHPALWLNDHNWEGFEWVDCNDAGHSVFSFVRKAYPDLLLCIHNASGSHYERFPVYLNWPKSVVDVFHTESIKYGGWVDKPVNIEWMPDHQGFWIDLPNLCSIIFKLEV